MGFLRHDRIKEIYVGYNDENVIKTTSTIRFDKKGWLWYRDNEKIVTINPASVTMIVEHLTDSEKPI